jgi:hypothetical protein
MHEQPAVNDVVNPSRGQSTFFWTMAVLSLLDLLFLFWIFNPFAAFGRSFGPAGNMPGREQTFEAAVSEPVNRQNNASKPSPLGEVEGLRLKQPAPLNASRRRGVTPSRNRRPPGQSPLVGMDRPVASTKGPS